MAEDPKLTGGTEGFPNAEDNNANVAAKLAAQDISGQSMAPKDTLDASNALDGLAKQAEEDAKKKAEATVEPKLDASVKTAEELSKDAEVKAAEEKVAAERAEVQKKADEFFKDSPGLPPNASPKSSESFSAIKIKAAQEIAARESEIEKLKKENADFQAKLKNSAPPETLKELEEHREWRAKLDLEADPKFKVFDKTVAETHEFIYAQLKKSTAIGDDVIEQIKKHGGPENVQMDKIFAAVKDPAMQRLIESKLADIEMAKFNKTQAIESAKKNIAEYVKGREEAVLKNATAHNVATETHFNELTAKLDWYKPKTADAKATDADKAAIESHNAFVADTQKNLAVAIKDDSPEMRAIMLAGMAQLFYLQNVHAGAAKKLETSEKALADVTAKYDKLRNASTTRLRDNLEISSNRSNTPAPKPSDQFTKTAGESLDDLRKQVTEERERASAAGGR
jgi:hypothetical protein